MVDPSLTGFCSVEISFIPFRSLEMMSVWVFLPSETRSIEKSIH